MLKGLGLATYGLGLEGPGLGLEGLGLGLKILVLTTSPSNTHSFLFPVTAVTSNPPRQFNVLTLLLLLDRSSYSD